MVQKLYSNMISAITYPNYCCLCENILLARANSTMTQTLCEAFTSSSVLAGVSTVPGPSIFSHKGVCLQPCLQCCVLHLPPLFLLLLWLPLALAVPAQPHMLLSSSCHFLLHLLIAHKLPAYFLYCPHFLNYLYDFSECFFQGMLPQFQLVAAEVFACTVCSLPL